MKKHNKTIRKMIAKLAGDDSVWIQDKIDKLAKKNNGGYLNLTGKELTLLSPITIPLKVRISFIGCKFHMPFNFSDSIKRESRGNAIIDSCYIDNVL